MKRSVRSRLLLVLFACLIAVAAFERWKIGRSNGSADISPNGRYFVQKYANWTPRSLWPTGPGQGSDGIGGYVRLFDHNGHLLEQRFVSRSRDVRAVWSGRKVYLMGVPEMDHAPWILPDSGE